MNSKDVKAVCLAIGIAVAWSLPLVAHAGTVANPSHRCDITPQRAMSHVYFLYAANIGADLYQRAVRVTGDETLPAGMTAHADFCLDTDDTYAWNRGFAIIGLFDADGDGDVDNDDLVFGGVAVSLSNDAASFALSGPNGLGRTWDDLFSVYDEFYISDALAVGDENMLEGFAQANFQRLAPWSDDGWNNAALVNFTKATEGGTVSAALVPEPSPFLVLATGLIGLLGRLRRKR
jgi:hypothetical protein